MKIFLVPALFLIASKLLAQGLFVGEGTYVSVESKTLVHADGEL